ncbi:unnamed protein product [marine sediment metagenome]|uniref:Uncharacterized protein n=1 Tax=marine sediment metagenome TaxID=412755 RepID=X1T395_9ZZZZ
MLINNEIALKDALDLMHTEIVVIKRVIANPALSGQKEYNRKRLAILQNIQHWLYLYE